MGKKNISTEIFLYVSIGFLVVIVLLCSIFLRYQRDITQDKINTSIKIILNQTSKSIDDKLKRSESLVRYFKLNSTLIDAIMNDRDYQKTKSIDKMISDMGNSRLWSEEYITIVGKNGNLFGNWEGDGRCIYSEEMKKLVNRISDETDMLYQFPFDYMSGYKNLDRFDKNKNLVGVASFIYDYTYEGEAVGMITVGIPTKVITDIMEKNRIFEGSQVYILGGDGDIMLGVPRNEGSKFIDMENCEFDDSTSSGYAVLWQDGKKMMSFFQKLNTGWIQMITIPYEIYMKEISAMIVTFVVVGMLSIVLALSISALISYSISKPIKELEKSIDQINRGDLKNRVAVRRTDDIGKLGIHFNAMADNLENLIEEKVETQKRTSELVIANKTAELKMLYAQINPHFLFNTLNSIRCLAIINKTDYLARMLESLGALLENSIMKGSDQTTIDLEISLLKKYIELYQMRYGKRLKAEFAVDQEIYACEIPKFMLQPLVENSIVHGIFNKIEGGSIIVRGWKEEEFIILEVEDDGVGIDSEKVSNRSVSSDHGIGITNIRERLRLIYNESCSLVLRSGPEGRGTVAVLRFPAKEYKGERDA